MKHAYRKLKIEFLKTRRERLSKQFFLQICQHNHRLHYLLNTRDSIMYNLRNASKYHCPIPKTERYKGSFIVHNLLQQYNCYVTFIAFTSRVFIVTHNAQKL